MTRPRRILVAEDELHIRRLIEVNLQRAGYVTELVEEAGVVAILSRERRPDLLILDLHMPYPQKTGCDVLRELRVAPVLADIPVILLVQGKPKVGSPEPRSWWERLRSCVGSYQEVGILDHFDLEACCGFADLHLVGALGKPFNPMNLLYLLKQHFDSIPCERDYSQGRLYVT